jgi:hypothetical protein
MSPLSTSSENLDTVSISSGISVDKIPPLNPISLNPISSGLTPISKFYI